MSAELVISVESFSLSFCSDEMVGMAGIGSSGVSVESAFGDGDRPVDAQSSGPLDNRQSGTTSGTGTAQPLSEMGKREMTGGESKRKGNFRSL